ncbi:MAG: DUF2497 domain-containing protein [Henriciella sp.]|nr:DUF2497 domain-containing protein [Henriciella sp.]
MAEPAQKEPTMEEILSSIRKIIADDDAPMQEAADTITEEELDVFDDIEVPEASSEDAVIESEEDVLAAISQSMEDVTDELELEAADEPVTEDEPFEFEVEEDSFESFAEEAFEGVEDFAEAEDSFQPVEEETLVMEAAPEPEPAPEIALEEETPMSAKPAPLTDTATVTAAAGALGKLLENVEFGEEAGGTTTIEGLVREMMRPMLKEWLDENLPGIVEKHVEAEVQRIARMAG